MEKLNMKKLAVFIICAFVMMIGIGLAIHYAELSDVVKTVVISVAMFTPLVAVIITQLLFKEPLLKGLGINFKFNYWWLIGLLLIPVISFLVMGISLLVPGSYLSMDQVMETNQAVLTSQGISPEQAHDLTQRSLGVLGMCGFIATTLINGLLAGATINAVLAFGEEIAWRGFLVKVLQGKKFILAAILIGLVWGAWHFPLVLNGHNYPTHPVIGVFMMILMCISFTPILLYFRLKSGSVIVPAIMHGTFNAMIPNFTLLVMPPNDLLIGGMGLAGIIAYLLISVLIFLYDRYISKENLFMKPMEPQARVPEIPSGN